LSNRITASAASAPFLVAPRHSTSTPAFQLISAGLAPRRAQALAKRVPSICTGSPQAFAASASRATVSGA
jgi:hypothetical protein